MFIAAMISLADSHIVTLPDGTSEFHCTIKLPARDDVSCMRAYERDAARVLAQLGVAIVTHGLQAFDANGEPLEDGGRMMTSKGQFTETYQASFGPCMVPRYVYQSAAGGPTYVPLEARARIIGLSTPLFASSLAAKYSESSGRVVQRDLKEHHVRDIALGTIQSIVAEVGRIALRKEPHWEFVPQTPVERVATIALGMDGACVHQCEDGWKQVMVGTIALYDEHGERLEDIAIANAPEDGKKNFFKRMDREIERFKSHYPEALWVGVSDGAKDLRPALEKHCSQLILDFYHASEYLAAASAGMAADAAASGAWLQQTLHELKHDDDAAGTILTSMERRLQSAAKLSGEARHALEKACGYFENNLDRMDYAAAQREHLPIGSGVTEAACKSLVKARLCGSGMRWEQTSMQHVLSLRGLRRSSNRWEQFWTRLDRVGY